MKHHYLFLFFWMTPVAAAIAQEPAALPEPLTLPFALQQIEALHPELNSAEQQLAMAQAGAAQVKSDWGIQTSIYSSARWLQPPDAIAHLGNQDHQAGASLRKPLYDFGGQQQRLKSAQAEVDVQQWQLLNVRQQHRIHIMQAYFDVILADMRYARSTEDMATGFIRYDRTRERMELGQASDVDVLQTQSDYYTIRRQRYQDDNDRRQTRARLALALGRPGELSAEVRFPDLSAWQRTLPEVTELQQLAAKNNPRLQSLQARVRAMQARLAAARSGHYPTISAAASAGWYQRETNAANPWVAELQMIMPLDTSGRTRSRVASARAELSHWQSQYELEKWKTDQAVLQLWLELDSLKYRQDESLKHEEYRELYLDRARALYEMEVKTDLGDAMVRLSEAAVNVASTEFRRAIVWETMDALTGEGRSR